MLNDGEVRVNMVNEKSLKSSLEVIVMYGSMYRDVCTMVKKVLSKIIIRNFLKRSKHMERTEEGSNTRPKILQSTGVN